MVFNGGGNTLALENGASFDGLVIAGQGDTLALSGDATTHCGGPGDGSFEVSVIGPALVGFGHFAKRGTSTWTLVGSKPETDWSAEGGTLRVNGAVGSVTVAAGATLGGTGSVGAIALNGGAVAPGQSPGTLSGASLAWNGGSSFQFELGSTPAQSDLLVLSGALSKGSGSGFAFHFTDGGGTPQIGTSYTLIQFDSQTGFGVGDFSFDYLGSGSDLRGHFVLSDKALSFVVDAPLPPPSPATPVPTMGEVSLALLGSLLAGVAALRLRRRRSGGA